MNRRIFLRKVFAVSGAFYLPPHRRFKTKHLVFIVNGAARKKDYYEDASLSPNIRRLAQEAFVFAEDHCEHVASHEIAFSELLPGPLLDCIGTGVQIHSICRIPHTMQLHRPRLLICRESAHDVGHRSYEQYLSSVRISDAAIGRVFDWIKGHPYFSKNTAIVIRPEFGRDDEVNQHGQLHHSYGFYYTHRVASIFWGPDFNQGVDRKTVISSFDMTPTLAGLFNLNATYAQGQVVPGLFRRR
ncbi:MAG: hypothetical protein DMG14_15240 [Acidobacteria bacterium]|nr:MAG: hypothetical protein DMG14_15240 [Acidobacteriota bacterium]